MKQNLTMKQYRMVDLFFMAVMLLITESLILFAATRWFPSQLYTVSVAGPITAIVMLRWKGFYAAIHAVLAGLIMCLILSASPAQYAIYCGGNLLSLLAVILVMVFGSTKIRKNALFRIGFGILVLVLMQTGRAVVALIFGYEVRSVVSFYTTDSLSLIFTAVIMWIAGRLDGLLEDQKEYVERINKNDEENKSL